MWAVRRTTSNYAKTRGLRLGASNVCANVERFEILLNDKLIEAGSSEFSINTWFIPRIFHSHSLKSPPRFSAMNRGLSSQAGTETGGVEDNDLEEGFSELESTETSEVNKDGLSDLSDAELSDNNDEDADDVEVSHKKKMSDEEVNEGEVVEVKNWTLLALRKLIIEEPFPSLTQALDKYFEDGKDLDDSEVSKVMLELRKRKLYSKALLFSEWLEANKKIDFTTRHYATHLDLICKSRGIHKGELYLEKIPKSFRDEYVYRTLLANCVSLTNVKKSEEIYNKMKQMGMSASAFTCNQMLLLYKRLDKKRIADVLLYMEKENVKPTIMTYKILIDAKGKIKDITGMEQILETMKAEGLEPDVSMKALVARYYVHAGLKVKAKSLLKDMEGSSISDIRSVCRVILPLYGELGMEDEVKRVWEMCEPKPLPQQYMGAIVAFGKLKKIEEAEAVFETFSRRMKLTSENYSMMLKVYVDNKMLDKGKELIKKMGESGCRIGPFMWDALVKLYLAAGEVEKADSILNKAIMLQENSRAQEKSKMQPLFSTFMSIMDHYARKGDVHNAEKIFYRMKQVGYSSRTKPFQGLLLAYQKAKSPPYGFKERMMADNVFPDKAMMAQLGQTNPFKKTAVSDLLD